MSRRRSSSSSSSPGLRSVLTIDDMIRKWSSLLAFQEGLGFKVQEHDRVRAGDGWIGTRAVGASAKKGRKKRWTLFGA